MNEFGYKGDSLVVFSQTYVSRTELYLHSSARLTVEDAHILMKYIERLDDNTFFHCQRVHRLAIMLSTEMGLSPDELCHLGLGGFLHDIGKFAVPLAILNKTTRLSAEEWEMIKEHPLRGYQFIQSLSLDAEVKQIVLFHHRWANGKGGYPFSDEEVHPSLLTQIVTVADVVDGITSFRPYRPPLDVAFCISFLEKYQGSQFNTDVVRIFKNLVDG